MAGEERQTGTRDEHYNLISALYHLLKGASTAEQYIRDAEESGDQDLAQFFRDLQDGQRDLAERAKNLLGTRMTGAQAGTGRKGSRKAAAANGAKASSGAKVPTRELRDQSNASINSGGNASDDLVDEQAKESFPASDPPAHY